MPYLVQDPPGNIAWSWFQAGCSTIPIRADGSKKPLGQWGAYQELLPTEKQVKEWFEGTRHGVAVVCGRVSGNLEMLELEGRATDSASLDKVALACEARGVLHLWEVLCSEGYAEWTPGGGLHFLYRLADHEVPGNTKIAVRFATTAELLENPKDKYRTLSETRGEGGYVIVAPTPGRCHESGEAWVTLAGAPGLIPTISWKDRCELHAAITDALDQMPPPPPPPTRQLAVRPDGELTPGDEFSARVDWGDAELLGGAGWTLESVRGGERMWTRPGKDPRLGASATTDYQGKPGLYVFSSSTGLPIETPLSKLFVYAWYNHGGDMSAAAKWLYQQGYGTRAVSTATIMGVADRAPVQTGPVQYAPDATTEVAIPAADLSVFSFTDTGNAERMTAMYPDTFRFVAVRNKWMFWDGGKWIVDFQAYHLSRAARKMVKEMRRQAVNDQMAKFADRSLGADRFSAILKMFKTEENVYATSDQFDANRNLLNATNGVLDLASGQLLPHDPSYMCTKMMGAAYRPEAECPRWDEYLQQVVPDAEVRGFLQRMVGYSLAGNPVQRALAILHGPGGTGKSRFVELLSSLFGSYGTTAAESLFRSKRDPSGPSNDLNDLRGARLASVSELDNGVRMDEALVKRLTGLDRITSRGLFEENQTWMPQCVIWLATNHLFKINSDDGAIWDRVKVIPFHEKIVNKDPFILDKLLDEADGILNWMLQGYRDYLEQGLEAPHGVIHAVDSYRHEQDVVAQFFEDSFTEERLTRAEDEAIARTQLYAMFRLWCTDNQEVPLGQLRFNRRVAAMGYDTVKRTKLCWLGIHAGVHGVLGSFP
jgi:putative DNA primase/helicase